MAVLLGINKGATKQLGAVGSEQALPRGGLRRAGGPCVAAASPCLATGGKEKGWSELKLLDLSQLAADE